MVKRKLLAAVISAGILMAGMPVSAADVPAFSLEEIVIQAEGIKQEQADTTVNVKTVSPGKAATIPELLRDSAGIDIQRRASAGDNQNGTIKLRGFDARRYTVLLNGRQINAAGVNGGQYIDWSAIPLNTVEKIQIIKGAKSAAHGNTMGGVINIITKDKGADGGEINVLAGSNGRYDYLFNYGATAGKLNFNVVANKTGADAYLRNNDYDAEQYGLRFSYDITEADRITMGFNRTDSDRGYIVANQPGANYDPAYPIADGDGYNPGSSWKKTNKYYDFSYRHDTEHGFIKFDYWKNDEQRRDILFNPTGTLLSDIVKTIDDSDSFGLSGQSRIGEHTIGYGTEYKRLRYGYGKVNYPLTTTPDYPSQKIDMWGTYVDDNWKLNDRWTGYFGLRYDEAKGRPDEVSIRTSSIRPADYHGLSPKLSFSFRNDEVTTTFISVNRLWRAPSMAEYFGWSRNYNTQTLFPGGFPNLGYQKELKPEKGMSYELGAEQKVSDKFNTKVTVYYQDIDDYINFEHNWPLPCYNIDNARVWGAEWENVYRMDDHNRLILNYTNQHTKKTGATQSNAGLPWQFDDTPRHKVALAYQYDAKPWQFRYNINYTSEQTKQVGGWTANPNPATIGGYAIHNLSVVRELDADRTLSLYVDNLLDKDYVEQYGYPMQGRSYYVSLTQKL